MIKGMGLGIGALGVTGTGYPNLIPFLKQPDDIVPGISTWYATSCRECPAGCGMVVRNREGHVVKCEGNPAHPVNRGSLCPRGQAALQAIYDPDRIRGPLRGRRVGPVVNQSRTNWNAALREVGRRLRERPRIAFITDLQTGSLDTLMRSWLNALGGGRFLVYEPINYEEVKAAFGVIPSFDIAGSDFIVSLGADFLETWISPVEYAVEFAENRQVRNGRRGRFVYVGPRVSMTAASADARILVPPDQMAAVALALRGGSARRVKAYIPGVGEREFSEAIRGLEGASAPLVLPGPDIESAQIAAGLSGGRADAGRPHALTNAATRAEVDDLVTAMENDQIDMLFIYRANPLFSYPDQARLRRAMGRVETIVSLSSFSDETTGIADWILPSNTFLESWGDYSPYPDVLNVIQPTMGRLFSTRDAGQILFDLAREAGVNTSTAFQADSYLNYLRRRWGAPTGSRPDVVPPELESFLQVGGRWTGSAEGSAFPTTGYESLATIWPAQQPTGTGRGTPAGATTPTAGAAPSAEGASTAPRREEGLKLWAYPSIYLYDGRGANKRWLQEMSEPVTKGCWSTWAEIHPATADRLAISDGDVIRLTRGRSAIEVPVYRWDGVHPDVIAVPIGQGHTSYGQYASNVGENVWPLLLTDGEVTVKGTGETGKLIRWKGDDSQHERDIAQVTVLGEEGHEHREVTMPLPEGYKFDDFYPAHEHEARSRWAMVVDMNRCIGCHACTVACYAENNIGVVGADGVKRNREMAWLRIDRYINWKRESAPVIFQPMLCQHCDNAPCEPVCPVFAAIHSEDGLNEQVYNRCVGTRYCSNNCPYKVRRFNWFDYQWPFPLNYQLNPDVTVRSRGVMEKCTFCVQRIRQARVVARRENRPLRDGEVTPACVQTCPTRVFTFGDLMDPNSEVTKMIREDPRAYQVLHELNTKTAVIYLRKVVER